MIHEWLIIKWQMKTLIGKFELVNLEKMIRGSLHVQHDWLYISYFLWSRILKDILQESLETLPECSEEKMNQGTAMSYHENQNTHSKNINETNPWKVGPIKLHSPDDISGCWKLRSCTRHSHYTCVLVLRHFSLESAGGHHQRQLGS